MVGDRIEQRLRLRAEPPLSEAAVLVRAAPTPGTSWPATPTGPPAPGRPAAIPLPGISVFAIPGIPPGELLSARLATYRVIHLPAAAALRDRGFELLPAGLRPHDTVRLRRADSVELGALLDAPGPPVANGQYAQSTIWREEGGDVPRRHHRRPQ